MLLWHLDENIDPAVALGLRRRGMDVTTTPPDVPKATPDAGQLEFCRRTRRVLVTHDPDFVALHWQGVEHRGIVFAPQRGRTIGQLVLGLADLNRQFESDDMVGRVEYI
jgi:hypothetical protein